MLNGDLFAAEQNWPSAIETYKKALAVQKAPTIGIKLYAALVKGGKQPEADQLTATLIKDNPEDLGVRMFAGEQSIAAKRWTEALDNYGFVIKREPTNGVALNNMAWAMFQLKDPKALQVAEQAYAALPQTPAVMDTFGYLSIEIGNANRGLELLRQATALAPKAGEIRIHLAQALAKTGDKDGAKKEIETVLRENPTGPVNELAKEAALKF